MLSIRRGNKSNASTFYTFNICNNAIHICFRAKNFRMVDFEINERSSLFIYLKINLVFRLLSMRLEMRYLTFENPVFNFSALQLLNKRAKSFLIFHQLFQSAEETYF